MLQESGAISLIQICNEYDITKPPYQMSKLYGLGDLPKSGKMTFTSFWGKSMFSISLQSHTFDVYTTKTVLYQ